MAKRKWVLTGTALAGMITTVAFSPLESLLPNQDLSLGMGHQNPYVPLVTGAGANYGQSAPAGSAQSSQPIAGSNNGKVQPKPVQPKPKSNRNGGSGTNGKNNSGSSSTPKPTATNGATSDPKPTDSGQPKPTTSSPAPVKTSAKPTPTKSTAQPTPTPTTAKPNGTFAASAAIKGGDYGTVVLKVTISNGVITSIDYSSTVTNDAKSYSINSAKLPVLVSEALSAQSAKISSVSGATYTSSAFKSALASALSKAGM